MYLHGLHGFALALRGICTVLALILHWLFADVTLYGTV